MLKSVAGIYVSASGTPLLSRLLRERKIYGQIGKIMSRDMCDMLYLCSVSFVRLASYPQSSSVRLVDISKYGYVSVYDCVHQTLLYNVCMDV